MTVPLKAGYETSDRRLDRIPRHDPRSLAYPVADVLQTRELKPRVWDLPTSRRLDQGRQGACLLFGFTHNRLGSPRPRSLPVVDTMRRTDGPPHFLRETARSRPEWDAFAFAMYRLAQQRDEWPGEEPAYAGTSTIAAAKAMQEGGFLDEYRWALGDSQGSYIDDVLGALSHLGPVVFATVWLAGMFDTDSRGVLHVTGGEAGGHGYAIRGWHRSAQHVPVLRGSGIRGPVLVGTNSWSQAWGRAGNFYLPVEDQPNGDRGAEWLLAAERMGECCVPLDRPSRGS